jgi:hypothetical protein
MATMLAWERRRWAALVGVLLVIIVLLLLTWPRPAARSDSVIIRVSDGPTVISTQIVPLR